MTTRSKLGEYQQVGFGGLAFLTHINLANTPMSYEQRLWSLDAEYWFTLAKIESDKRWKDDREIAILISGVHLLLDQASDDYQSKFESHETYCPLENNYKKLLRQIMGRITQIQGIIKMIEENHDGVAMVA
jgi:hypothetical protein